MKGKKGTNNAVNKRNRAVLWVSRNIHASILQYAEERGGLKIERAADELLTLALRVARVPVVGWIGDTTEPAVSVAMGDNASRTPLTPAAGSLSEEK